MSILLGRSIYAAEYKQLRDGTVRLMRCCILLKEQQSYFLLCLLRFPSFFILLSSSNNIWITLQPTGFSCIIFAGLLAIFILLSSSRNLCNYACMYYSFIIYIYHICTLQMNCLRRAMLSSAWWKSFASMFVSQSREGQRGQVVRFSICAKWNMASHST